MIDYLIGFSGFGVGFYLLFRQFLRHSTHFKLSRIYLLLTFGLALVLPLVQFSEWITLPISLELSWVEWHDKIMPYETLESSNSTNFVFGIYGVGFCLQFFRFLSNLMQIGQLIERYPQQNNTKGIHEICVPKLLEAFSFFNFLFLPEAIHYSEKEFVFIKEHETQHIIQNHSQEILFFEILMPFLWFHPLIYRYKNELQKVHEFSADVGVLEKFPDVQFYQKILVSNFIGEKNLKFTHPFSEKKLLQYRLKLLSKYGEKTPLSSAWIWSLSFMLILGIFSNSIYHKIVQKQENFQFEKKAQKAVFPPEFQGKKEFEVSEKTNEQRFKTVLKAGKEYTFDLDHDSDLPKGTRVILYDSEGNLVAENFGKYKSNFTFRCSKTDIYTLRVSFQYAQFQGGKLQVDFD